MDWRKIISGCACVLLFICLFFVTFSFAAIDINIINPKELKKYFPKGWEVKEIKVVEAPYFWSRTAGGNGVSIFFERPETNFETSPKGGIMRPAYHLPFEFIIMPLDWEGDSFYSCEKQIFKKGKLIKEATTLCGGFQSLGPVPFAGRISDFYVFVRASPEAAEYQFVRKYLENLKN